MASTQRQRDAPSIKNWSAGSRRSTPHSPALEALIGSLARKASQKGTIYVGQCHKRRRKSENAGAAQGKGEALTDGLGC